MDNNTVCLCDCEEGLRIVLVGWLVYNNWLVGWLVGWMDPTLNILVYLVRYLLGYLPSSNDVSDRFQI